MEHLDNRLNSLGHFNCDNYSFSNKDASFDNASIFKDYCDISQCVTHIEKKMNQNTLTAPDRIKFHKDLEKVQARLEITLKNAQNMSSKLFGQLQKLGQQLISLYGQIEKRFEDCEVRLIAKEALKLEDSDFSHAVQVTDHLKERIKFFYQDNLPSLANRKILYVVQKLIDPANKRTLASAQLFQILKNLIQDTLARTESTLFQEDAELIAELYEIGDLYMQNFYKEGRKRLNALHLPVWAMERLKKASSDVELGPLLHQIAEELTYQGEIPQLSVLS